MKTRTGVLIILILIVSIPITNPIQQPQYNIPNSLHAKQSFVVSSDPVTISGDSDFSTQGWPGNGSVYNPYRIENLTINTSGGSCISVQSTSVYFKIRNCTLSGSDDNHAAIYLQSVVNGSILNNTIQNVYSGIDALLSDSCYVRENSISAESIGIILQVSTHFNITDNQFLGCGIQIAGSSFEYWNHEISNNFVDSRPITYLKDTDDVFYNTTIPAQVILLNCSRVSLVDSYFSESTVAIQIAYSEDIVLENLVISKCDRGGIYFTGVNRSNIVNCTIINSWNAIDINNSENTTISDCECSGAFSGLYIVNTEFVSATRNTIYRSGQGVLIFSSDFVNITSNRIVENGIGVLMFNNNVLLFKNNSVAQNTQYGINVIESTDCEFYYNEFAWNNLPNAQETDCTCTWDDNVSLGNGWSDYGGIGDYNITGDGNGTDHGPWNLEIYFPQATHHSDIEISENSSGIEFTCDAFDLRPWWYKVYLNGTLLEEGLWDGSSINVSFDAISIGSYPVSVYFENIYGASVWDLFTLDVLGAHTIEIISSLDPTYHYGSIGHSIHWNFSTDVTCQYEIHRNGTWIQSGGRSPNQITIEIPVDGLYWGVYEFALNVWDDDGGWGTDTIWVTVLGPERPIIKGPADFRFTNISDSNLIFWEISDDNAEYYEIMRNGSVIENGYCRPLVVFYVGLLSCGIYNYTIIVTDSNGMSSSDSVIVTVSYLIDQHEEIDESSSIPLPFVEISIAIVGICFAVYLFLQKHKEIGTNTKRLPKMYDIISRPKLKSAILIVLVIGGLLPFVFWNVTKPEPVIRVAVIDSGIDIVPELEGRVVASRSFVVELLGYDTSDNSTTDSRPYGTSHGTNIARIIAQESKHALIVNAKVLTSSDDATSLGIDAAIKWAVEEQNCSIVNLSIGGPTIINDRVAHAIEWAFRKGALVITSAGNEGERWIGSSMTGDSSSLYSLAVGAIDEFNSPENYSSSGPGLDMISKPDLCALGTFIDGIHIGSGTSYAAPRVCAAAAEVLYHCMTNNWKHTPGMLKALLMKSAQPLSFHIFKTGAGKVDVTNAIAELYELTKVNDLPIVTYIHPKQLPFSDQKIYSNTRYQFTISIFTSDIVNYSITANQDGTILKYPRSIVVDQAVYIPITVTTLDTDATIDIALRSENAPSKELSLELYVTEPISRIAIDTSLTVNANYTSFGRYTTLIETLDGLNVSVSEFNTLGSFLDADLHQYDALWVLSPYTTNIDLLNPWYYYYTVHEYSIEHTRKLMDFIEHGGNVFLAANLIQYDKYDTDGYDLCTYPLNMMLEEFPISLESHLLVDENRPRNITNFSSHELTISLDGIQHVGPWLQTGGDVQTLAWFPSFLSNGSPSQCPILSLYSEMDTGTFIISSSDFFLSNLGLTTSPYSSSHLILIENIIELFKQHS